MKLKDTGFRWVYHYVCAFELNDKLRELIKECPDVAKASHAVCYGYIDAKKGLMLEVLCAGKQAPKYFYFKDTYEGKRITIPASELKNVEFILFDKLEPRFRKKLDPRIEPLKKYDAPEELEKTRGEELGFLDAFRDLQHPDVVRVAFYKDGLQVEEIPVRLTGTGDHYLIGIVQKNPKQDFGSVKGDTVYFNARQTEENKIEIYLNLNTEETHKLTQADLDDGSFLKICITEFLKDKCNQGKFEFLLAVLRSSSVIVPCDIELTDAAKAIADKIEAAGKTIDDLEGEDAAKFAEGMILLPRFLENSGHKFLPAFTNEDEIGDQMDGAARFHMPFLHVIEMAAEGYVEYEGIVINAFTDDFIVNKELFEIIPQLKPLFDDSVEEKEKEKEETDSNTSHYRYDIPLEMRIGRMDVFNYAFYQNNIAPIRDIQLLNHQQDTLKGLYMRITSDFHFFKKYEAKLPDIPGGKPVTLPDPELMINGSMLAKMTETVSTVITVEILKDGERVCFCRGNMQVLAYDQWQGGASYRELLPAFVLPNHPVIPALLHDAAERLKKWGKNPSLEGYQMHDPNRVRDLSAAAYAAIQKKNIVYANPPASFFKFGQRIRTPEIIMEQRLGTCMDMTLLYAAVLEAMGLHSLLVLKNGHIFAGVWLKERTEEELKKSDAIIDNIEKLKMRFGTGTDEMTFIECTAMCASQNVNFEDAEKIAKYDNLADKDEFQYAIDVELCRRMGIRAIPERTGNSSIYEIDINDIDENEIIAPPADKGIKIYDEPVFGVRKISGKRELWESKLLDLSSNNMLLDLPKSSKVLPIMSAHIDELEDAISDGHEFNLMPIAEWIAGLTYTTTDEKGKNSKPVQWLPKAIKEHGIFEITNWPVLIDFDFNEQFRQEFRNHRLYTFCTPKQLEHDLTTIYRAARSSQQENGVSSLYLAVGLLRWVPDSKTPCYAPLVLVPVEIVRKPANLGYALHAREDDPHFNTALLEMLKQNYDLVISGLEPLPADDHGVNIKKVFSIVRNAVFKIKGWDVVESCVVGNFSFANFAMWNDIHTAGEMLEKSNVVRSMIKGHVDWDASTPDTLDKEQTYLPITVDATQLQAIKMAAHGASFVLHGPPGTGKSQTITGMIANLMAQGKKVLFVAEKMAALSVVQRRLASLGIGNFCLELHSDKASKKQVLAQLEKALSIKHPSERTEYEEYLAKSSESRVKLDGYAKHLHAVHECGYSLRELIDLFETVRDSEKYVSFNKYAAGTLTKEQIKRHSVLIGQLIAAGGGVGSIAQHPFTGIGLTSYMDVRSYAREFSEMYRFALEDARECSSEVAGIIGIDVPESKDALLALVNLIELYDDKKGTQAELLTLLRVEPENVYSYYELQREAETKKENLLNIWHEDFLDMDMSALLAKHNAAGKKFFGKSSAMAAITAEVQAKANIPVTYEDIPEMLKHVVKYQQNSHELKNAYAELSPDVRFLVDKYHTREEYQAAESAASMCKKQAESFPGGLDAIITLAAQQKNEKLFAKYKEIVSKMLAEEERLNKLLERTENEEPEHWIEKEIEFCNYLIKNAYELKDWTLYNKVRRECIENGLAPVVEAYENGLDASIIYKAYQKGLYYALINKIISSDDTLNSFSGATFNETIQQFKRLDEQLLLQTKQEIYYSLASCVPTSWDSPEVGMELNLLRKAIGSNARGISIRELFERIPHILQELCPCMLMSPNSVAQYLAQDNELFDVVIFDEASQLPTCKAIGALARAKAAVIVGDPKQMPPTSFFDGAGPEVEDITIDDLDSILDDALALGIPSQHLQWHYRSTHESLIAFSNNHFYDNKMYTFPSANDRERHVTAVHVDGQYNKGTNVKEAEAVVQEIVRRFLDPDLKKQSIGVVTFNKEQMTLIENILAKQFKVNPELDVWANSGDDPLFIKNLENVQGDERDVILFSIGYGPDEKGRISMNFGPINKAGGGKRLNVAFSRARVTMTIFASLYSTDIKVTETSPEGLIAFRDFLKFAEGHDMLSESTSESADKVAKAGILQRICEAITERGYQCVKMVGHSDFRVDIAVVDPYVPTKYIMGILLDGEGYRKTKNTRDREVAQIGVLKNLGWTIHRVWTIDWWDNREKVIRNLLGKLDALKEESRRKNEEYQAAEQAKKAEEAARAEEVEQIKAQLEAQAAEVVAEEEEVENERTASEIEADHADTAKKGIEAISETVTAEENAKSKAANIVHDPNTNEAHKPMDELLNELLLKVEAAKGKVIDKRKNNGALWIIGGKNLSPIIKEFKALGIHFSFKAGGGKATGGKDGWWSKTDVILPTPDKKSKTAPKPVFKNGEMNNPEPKAASMSKDVPSDNNIFYCEKDTYKAVGFCEGKNFIVLKGSRISSSTTAACPESTIALRKKYADSIGPDFVLTEDISFASPSGAACFVTGTSRSGYTLWHLEDGTLLKDIK